MRGSDITKRERADVWVCEIAAGPGRRDRTAPSPLLRCHGNFRRGTTLPWLVGQSRFAHVLLMSAQTSHGAKR